LLKRCGVPLRTPSTKLHGGRALRMHRGWKIVFWPKVFAHTHLSMPSTRHATPCTAARSGPRSCGRQCVLALAHTSHGRDPHSSRRPMALTLFTSTFAESMGQAMTWNDDCASFSTSRAPLLLTLAPLPYISLSLLRLLATNVHRRSCRQLPSLLILPILPIHQRHEQRLAWVLAVRTYRCCAHGRPLSPSRPSIRTTNIHPACSLSIGPCAGRWLRDAPLRALCASAPTYDIWALKLDPPTDVPPPTYELYPG
jgi:hypothetical protein